MQKPQETQYQWEVALTPIISRKYSWWLSQYYHTDLSQKQRSQRRQNLSLNHWPTCYTPQLLKSAWITLQMPHYLTENTQPIAAPNREKQLRPYEELACEYTTTRKISRMVIVDGVKLAQSNTQRPKKPPTYFPQATTLQDATVSPA